MIIPGFLSKLVNFNSTTARFSMNLLAKFSITFFVIILIPFIVFTYIADSVSNEIIKRNNTVDAINSMAVFCHLMDRKLFYMEYLTNQILSDKNINDYDYKLNLGLGYDLPVYGGDELAEQITGIDNGSITDCCNIYLVNSRSSYNLYLQDYSKTVDYKEMDCKWFNSVLQQSKSFCLLGTNKRLYSDGSSAFVISSACYLKDCGSIDSDIVLIDYDFDSLITQIFDKITAKRYLKDDFYILDSNKDIVYCKKSDILATKFDHPFIRNGEELPFGSKQVSMDDEKYYMAYYNSPYNRWTYITFIPLKKINASPFPGNSFIIVLSILLLALVVFFAYVASSAILSPINILVRYMKEIKNGNLQARIKVKRNDETRLLSESFNEMASNLENMIKKVYVSEIKRKESELLSLQSQINPHFLYNTLDSIRGTAIASGEQEIASMSRCLASMLKYSIEKDMVVSIKDEVKHVQNYLQIQNFRFDNKFTLNFDISEELEKCRILKLTLQPLVENSIIHGLEKMVGKGIINVSFTRIDNLIRITVWDNGAGMSPEKIEALNRMLEKGETNAGGEFAAGRSGRGIGIQNVNTRIKLYFGEQYRLKFVEGSSGTLLDIEIPFINEEDLHEIDNSR